MAERAGYTVKRDPKMLLGEVSSFPFCCKACIGPDRYIKVLRCSAGAQCKICGRVFSVFTWRKRSERQLSRTIVCATCARLRNSCQSCVLDIDSGLPLALTKANLIVSEGNADISAQIATERFETLPLPIQERKPDPAVRGKAIRVEWVEEDEVEMLKKRFSKLCQFGEYKYSSGRLVASFADCDQAAQFLRVFQNNLVIEGKKRDVNWLESVTQPEVHQIPEPPLTPTVYAKQGKKLHGHP